MKRLFQIIGLIACSASLLSAGTWNKEETYSTSSKLVQGVMDHGYLSVSRFGDKYYLYSVKVSISEGLVRKEQIDVSGKPYLNGNFPVTVDDPVWRSITGRAHYSAAVSNDCVRAGS
jgi:hypothetical protein